MATLGDFDTSAVVYGKFTTYRPSTGAAHTLGGTPAVSVYKDNSTTQSTTGVTLTADFDSVTGLNHFAIDTSADGTFYSAGSFFDVVITTGTVDSVSVVGAVVASFSLRKNSALKPTTAGRTLDVSSGGEAGIDWANVGSPTTTLALTGTTIASTQKVDVDTIKTNAVVNGGTITFPTNSTLASTTNITAGTITTTTNLTNAPSDSSGVTTLLSRLSSARAGYLDNLSAGAAALEASVQSVLSKLLKYVQLILRKDAAIATDNATELTAINANGGSGAGGYDNTTDSQEALRDRGDAAWATVSAASIRSAVGLASANLDTQLDALPTTSEVNAEVDTALADVGLTTTVTGRIDAAISTRLASASYTAQSGDAYARLGAPAGASIAADIAAVKVDTAAILDDTGTSGVVVAAGSKTGYQLSSAGVDDILDEAVEGSTTLRQSIRLHNAALGGKASGLETTTVIYRDLADTKDRITTTVSADEYGNRLTVVRDLT